MLAPSSGDPREGRFYLLSTTLEYAFLGATYKYKPWFAALIAKPTSYAYYYEEKCNFFSAIIFILNGGASLGPRLTRNLQNRFFFFFNFMKNTH